MTAEPQAVKVVEAQPSAVVQQQQQPAAVVQQPQVVMQQPQPQVVMQQPQPQLVAQGSQPAVVMQQPQPQVIMQQPQQLVAQGSQPQVVMMQQQPAGNPPPVGAPAGGIWVQDAYCGMISWCICFWVGLPCIVMCPLDKRMVYMVGGQKFLPNGTLVDGPF